MATIKADQAIPTMQSMAEDWIAWYKIIPTGFFAGNDERNQVFLSIWRKNGSPKANTHALRDFLKTEAGINLTTDGIGSFVDAAYSTKDSIVDLAKIPLYLFIGASVLTVFMICFLGYQAIKNPEVTGVILGTAARTAVTKGAI